MILSEMKGRQNETVEYMHLAIDEVLSGRNLPDNRVITVRWEDGYWKIKEVDSDAIRAGALVMWDKRA